MIAALALVALCAAPETADSVFRVEVYNSPWDWQNPWVRQPAFPASGSGFLLSNGRIITNGHVVAGAKQVLLRRHDVPNPTIAKVEFIGYDVDLALLSVSDPAFLKGLKPLDLGPMPAVRTQVTTFGYPMGGKEASSTQGIISRVEFRTYVFTGADDHLAVQTDAAINPGNSGGPVIQGGKVVGVAFQGMGGDNIGYFIPVPVLRHFLEDVADGKYDGFPDSGFGEFTMTSPALRKERGLPKDLTGVLVQSLTPGGSGEGLFKVGDVLLSLDGTVIDDVGRVLIDGNRISLHHLLDMKQVGQPFRATVWRDGKKVELTGPSKRIARSDRMRMNQGIQPRYYLYAGMLFMPLSAALLANNFGRSYASVPRELLWHLTYREMEQPETAEDERVVLMRVFKHPVNSQLITTGSALVEKINEMPIRKLEDVPAALAKSNARFHLFEYFDNSVDALDREAADSAHPEILKSYAISSDHHF